MRIIIIIILIITSSPLFAQEYVKDNVTALNEEIRRIRYKADNSNKLESTEAFYLGDENTNGSWRIIRDGNNLVFERRESDAWVTKDTITP